MNHSAAERQAVTVSELSPEEAEEFIREPVASAQQETQLEVAELTLGILLGGFAAEQRGEFYDRASLMVS